MDSDSLPNVFELLPFLALAISLLAALAIFLWWRKREADRRDALRSLALGLGFHYSEEDESVLTSEFAVFHLFKRGGRRRAENVLRRSEGDLESLLFDYRYRISSGNNNNTHRQSVAAFRFPALSLPRFDLRPENLLHKIGSAFGYRDIDFEGHPEFSRRYLLRGEDESSVRQVFGPAILAALTQTEGWWIEGGGEWVVLYRHRKRAKPDELRSFIDETRTLARSLTGR